jgi:hypothetical protein
MVYESNPKHAEPWTSGRRGTLCPREITLQEAQRLLDTSDEWGAQRFAVRDGRPYCANEHSPGRWHGHPILWEKVPRTLVLRWVREGRVRRSETRD